MRIAALLFVLLAGCSGTTPLPDDTLRVLYIGNSLTYTNDLPGMVAEFADAHGRPMLYASTALPNFSLEDHWTDGRARTALLAESWDVVVMQQGPSSLPENQEHLALWATRWSEEVRSVGAEPALYMVWPSEDRSFAFQDVIDAYSEAAEASEALLLPAGSAWVAAWDRDSDLPLYGPDGFHPSDTGTYLAALVIYGGLTEAALDDLPAVLDLPDGQVRIPGTQARLLREVAASTVGLLPSR